MTALIAPRLQRVRTPLGFIGVALLAYVIDGAIAHSAIFAARPELFAPAISIDLTLVVTLAYWLLVVRPGHAPPRSVLPVFLLSVGAAAVTLPTGHRDFVQYIRYLGAPFELAIVVLVVVGVRRTQRALSASGVEMDVPERIRSVLAGALPYERVAKATATEVTLLFYAFASWRRAPFVTSGAQGFAYHRRNSYAAILYTLVVASVVEMVAAHFLLRVIAPRVAIPVLLVSAFGTFWLVGFVRAVQLRPVLLATGSLLVRNGIRWSIDIPHTLVERAEYGRVKVPDKRTPGYLRVAPGQVNVLIQLREPVHAVGPYGTTRAVSRVGLWIDDLSSFQSSYAAFMARVDLDESIARGNVRHL